jgi:hypothetical protein
MTNGGVWMTTAHALDDALSPELEAIATAAHDRLQAQAGQDLSAQEAAQRRVAEAARAAIAAGATLGGRTPSNATRRSRRSPSRTDRDRRARARPEQRSTPRRLVLRPTRQFDAKRLVEAAHIGAG